MLPKGMMWSLGVLVTHAAGRQHPEDPIEWLQGGSAMNATLNLVEHVLALGRRYQEVGRHRDAVRVFTRLSGFSELPAAAAEETQARLAEIHLKRRLFLKARRHLAAALRHSPGCARYHYLMATALQSDDRGDLERAAGHLLKALELDPQNIRCLADYGLLCVRRGHTAEGLDRLRQAAERAPDDAGVLGKVVKGLRLAGKSEEARRTLRTALFRNAKAPRFRKLWAEFQIDSLRRRAGRAARKADDGPVVLPFVRGTTTNPPAEVHPTILRADQGRGGEPKPSDERNVQ
jgi:tetratricopeptide (TPR) repeat protein